MVDDTGHISEQERREEGQENLRQEKPPLRHVNRIELMKLYRQVHPPERLGEAKQQIPSESELELFALEHGLTLEDVIAAPRSESRSTPHSKPVQSMSDDEVQEDHDWVKAATGGDEEPPANHPPGSSNRSRILARGEELEEEMERRQLGDYAHLADAGSTKMPALAATDIAEAGGPDSVEASSQLPQDGTSAPPPEDGAQAASPPMPSPEDETERPQDVLSKEPDQKLLQQIAALWHQTGITPSYAITNALEYTVFATRTAPIAVTPWQFLLGLIRDGERAEYKFSDPNDLSLQRLLSRRLRFRQGTLSQLWQSSLKDARSSGGSQHQLSPALRRVLQRAAEISRYCSLGQIYVAARHFVAALLEHLQGGAEEDLHPLRLQDLQECLEEHLPFYAFEDIPKNWQQVLADIRKPRPRSPRGTSSMFRRESSSEELCLGIDDYSSAIKEAFQNAAPDNDFVFGLFAPWGRGKSTLMNQVAEKLSGTHQIVKFGAAKYPSRPEVWVHLYQTIADAAMEPGFWAKWRLRIRIGLLRTGWRPLFVGIFAASFSAFVWMGWAAGALLWIFHGIGLLGFLVIVGYLYRFFGLGKLIHNLYGHIPDHSDKLGLQAVIGDDLERLLRAWFPSRSPMPPWSDWKFWEGKWWGRLIGHFTDDDSAVDFRPCRCGWLAAALCLVLLATGCYLGASSSWQWISRHHTPNGTVTVWNWLALVPFAGLMIFAVVAVYMIARGSADARRALLIVDDLDRCDPAQSLSVIESIRWFLDTPSVSSRLHVAMLMERTALEAACKQRAEEAKMLPPEAAWSARFRAHREKLFVVELSMPSLLQTEVEDLVSRAIEREDQNARKTALQNQLARHIATAPKPRKHTVTESVQAAYTFEGEAVSPPVTRTVTSTKAVSPSADEKEKHRAEEARLKESLAAMSPPLTPPPKKDEPSEISQVSGYFSPAEVAAIKAAFRYVPAEEITPRSVRAAMIRYQFARRLLSGVDLSPQI
ncbi:KAP family P-loop domain-containing protein [Prosthecobacter debontii]|uniref:KAP family P-loop domain-containing protein n=1 Tax=Prosthecobacter debontii TaxID=48467 RepID=A0A1T4YK40_9BACT|nr:P-loop NTPase fold protein [Prosthecobacter debontii]SKB01908.1 KAP family P-loop domain-containing protein [Prosthecobacter debontii]